MVFDVVLHTMLVFFLILATGFAAGKLGIVKRDFLPELARLITKVLLPCLVFRATVTGCTRQTLAENLPMLGLAAAFYALVALLAFLVASLSRLPGDKGRVFMLCFVFGNTGFVGIPLLSALFPREGLLYMALFGVVDTPVFWTFGVWLATPKKRCSVPPAKGAIEDGGACGMRHMFKGAARILLTPNVVAMALAFVFVLVEIPIPGLVDDALSTVSSATSAMCMVYLGALLCFSDFAAAFRSRELYAGVAVKMVGLPCVAALLLHQTPLPADMVAAITLIAALPTMTIVPMVAAQHGLYGDYAAGLTVATLVFSIATIPLVAFLVL